MKPENKLAKLRERVCVICGKHFFKHIAPSEIALGHGVVCSKECKGILIRDRERNGFYKICEKCGKEFWVSKSKEKYHHPKFCSRICWNPIEKGMAISIDGYYVICGIKVHRTMMENKIGRKLLSSEIVHHKNGNKLDNRLKNLQIVSRSEHNKIHKFLTKGYY